MPVLGGTEIGTDRSSPDGLGLRWRNWSPGAWFELQREFLVERFRDIDAEFMVPPSLRYTSGS